jgi:putative redox protein
MTRIEVVHETGLRFRADIQGHPLVFDQPIDQGGDDLGPTPTDVFVASLAGCVAYYAVRFLERHGQPTEGLRVGAEFAMAAHPARVGSIELVLTVPNLPQALRAPLLAVAEHCTVHNSMRRAPDVQIQLGGVVAAQTAPADRDPTGGDERPVPGPRSVLAARPANRNDRGDFEEVTS